MAETITMPKLGFDMAEGTLVRWVIAEGEEVKKGAVLAEIETDKATVEVDSAYEGVLRRQLVNEGDAVPVGTPIAVVGGADEKIDLAALTAAAETAAKPAEGEPAQPEAAAEAQAAAPQGEVATGRLKASPLARRMAEEKGIDLRQLHGSGPDGRVVKRDVESFHPVAMPQAAPVPAAPGAAVSQAPAAPTLPVTPILPIQAGPSPADQPAPLSRLRAAIGRRMTEAKQQAPHFYVTHEYDMAPVMALRKQANALLPEGEKLSVNDFIVKAVALALRQFPNVNAALNGNQVVRRGAVNIGVAVAVEGGLLTVVCRDADRKSLRQISVEVRGMAARAREGKVKPEDIEGSTFSISNLGMYDVENFAAIINPPEAAILAVGSAREVPVVENGEVKPGLRMKATISIDHRVSDGAEAARFMQVLAQYLQEPMRLML